MPDAPEPTAAGVRVLDHAVLRVAAWPIEIVDELTAPALADAARAVIADRAATAASPAMAGPDAATNVDRLAEEIHAAVPAVGDRSTRRWLLAARRALRTPAQLVPPAPVGAADALAHLEGGSALLTAIETAGGPRAEALERRSALADAFDQELTRSRRALRSIGASDRFRAALAIAEPSVLVRWDATRDKALNDKARVRRLEATVLHFAMRACGRPTPNGGWSGVAAVVPDQGEESSGVPTRISNAVLTVRDAPRRAHVSVDLVPFATVLTAWAHQLGGARDHPLRREPTVRDDAGSTVGTAGSPAEGHRWVYLRRDAEPAAFVALATVDELRTALDRWPPGTVATPAALYDEVGENRGRAVVEHLLACGVLHSALALPAFAASPADAVEAVTALLPAPLDRSWTTTIHAIGDATRSLEAAFLADDVAGVVRYRDEIHSAVSTLTVAAGLGDAPDRGLVHVDLGVPWRATWCAAGRAAVGRALDDVFAFHAADGGAEAYRAATAGQVRATGAGDVLADVATAAADWVGPPPAVARRADLLRAVGLDPLPGERRWTARLDPVAAAGREVVELDVRPTVEVHPGVSGSFIVAVGSATWARWGRPQPGMFATRFVPLLQPGSHEEGGGGRQPRGGAGSAVASLAAALRRMGAARIVAADAPNPNAALRPPLDDVPTWGWSLAPDVVDPPTPTVARRDGAVVIRTPDRGDLVPVYDSAAVIGTRDPVSRFVRTAAMTHGWELAAWGFPVLEAELDRWVGLPRLVLPARSGPPDPPTVLAPRRWVVGGAVLEAVRAETDEVERYLAWRAEMDRRDIPAIVVARWALLPDAPELILATESPLALRCLCERLADGPAALVLSELPGPIEEWPVRSAEGHHLSELAVTWVRRTPPLDPSVFPGEVVPGSFGAILDALDDADPAPVGSDATGEVRDVEHHQRDRFVALLEELVEPGERSAVAQGAAEWLMRVADAQDPDGAGRGSDAAATRPHRIEQTPDRRLRADLASLRPAFDADIAAIAAREARGASGVDRVPDERAVRTQLIARLGHIDAVSRWGEGPDRLRVEASVWLTTPTT